MKLLLTHAYFLCEDAAEQKIMRPYPPLGLLSVSAYLEEQGVNHEVLDTTFITASDWMEEVEAQKPDLIAFYVNLMTKVKVLQLIRKLKKITAFNHIRFILGGPDVSYNWEKYLTHGADYLIIGEGEQSMYELLMNLNKNQPLAGIPGLAFRNEVGDLIKNPARVKIKNIDQLPLPNRKKIDLKPYLHVWKKHHGKSALNISTQRGCPYTCEWCSTAVYGQSYRRRSPRLVADEIEYLIKNYQVESLWFVDDVFTVSHKWMTAFAEEMEKRKLSIPYECITRAERLNKVVLEQLKATGCFRIWIGAESGSQRIIDLMKRQVDIEKVAEMMQLTKSFGIKTGTFIMLGYPTETMEDIEHTINYLKSANPDEFTLTLAYPIKGTALYHRLEKELIINRDWAQSTDRDIDFKRTYPKSFYKHAIRRVYNEVRLHQAKQDKNRNQWNTLVQKLKVDLSMFQMRIWADFN